MKTRRYGGQPQRGLNLSLLNSRFSVRPNEPKSNALRSVVFFFFGGRGFISPVFLHFFFDTVRAATTRNTHAAHVRPFDYSRIFRRS